MPKSVVLFSLWAYSFKKDKYSPSPHLPRMNAFLEPCRGGSRHLCSREGTQGISADAVRKPSPCCTPCAEEAPFSVCLFHTPDGAFGCCGWGLIEHPTFLPPRGGEHPSVSDLPITSINYSSQWPC